MSKKSTQQQTDENFPERPLLYCGPSIPGIAPHGMLFTEMPPLLRACVEECPAIKSFIVEPRDYVHIKRQADHKGSLLHTQLQTVLEYLRRR